LLKSSFDSVLAENPDAAASHSIQGYLHESRNEIEEALDQYRQAGDHFAAGRLLTQNVRLQEAEAELRAAVAADPQNDRAKADLGRLYLQEDEAGKALEILRQLVQQYPGDAYASADLGKAEGKLGSSENAVQHLRKALELNPSLYQIHYQLATLYRQQGKEEFARPNATQPSDSAQTGHSSANGGDRGRLGSKRGPNHEHIVHKNEEHRATAQQNDLHDFLITYHDYTVNDVAATNYHPRRLSSNGTVVRLAPDLYASRHLRYWPHSN
jgi:tetratricopeptide (TPR) repeat protein